MATFQPPNAQTLPPVLPPGTPGQSRTQYRLMRHFANGEQGQTVLKINGTYGTYYCPDANLMASATEVYQGGHIYTVSSTVATALTAAGYGAGIS